MSDATKRPDAFCAALEGIADALVAIAAPKMIEKIEAHFEVRADPLMTVKEGAVHLGISEQKLRDLIHGGFIKRAPGIAEIRVRQSVLDAYGKPEKAK